MFVSLVTDFPVDIKQWDVLPMPVHVIQAVEAMAERQGQPLLKDDRLIFEWRPGVPLEGDQTEDQQLEMKYDEDVKNMLQDDLQEIVIEDNERDDQIDMEEDVVEVMPVVLEDETENDEIGLEESDTMCEDEVQEQLVEDATHDVDEIRSEIVRDEIGSENNSEYGLSDTTTDDSDRATSECAGIGYNLRSKNNRD